VEDRDAEDWRGLGPGLVARLVKAAMIDRGIEAHLDAGYQSDLANLRGIAWGFIAPRHAAGEKTR
jgi:hypothetical protein